MHTDETRIGRFISSVFHLCAIVASFSLSLNLRFPIHHSRQTLPHLTPGFAALGWPNCGTLTNYAVCAWNSSSSRRQGLFNLPTLSCLRGGRKDEYRSILRFHEFSQGFSGIPVAQEGLELSP